MRKAWKVIRGVLLGAAALLLVLLVTVQFLLRPSTLTGIVNKLAAQYVEGSVSFEEVKAHVVRSFPYVNIEATHFSITYPHQRYAQWDSIYQEPTRRFSLLRAGQGRTLEQVDTLASFGRLGVAVNYMAFLSHGDIHVHRLELEHPRIFAHYYDSTAANWDILPIGGSEEASPEEGNERETGGLPRITLSEIKLTNKPFIVYTNPKDTLLGMFTMRRLVLDGKLDSKRPDRSRAAVSLDSLWISGRLPADTVALALERLRMDVKDRHMKLDAQAAARLATGSYGRLRVPIGIQADASFPERADKALEVDLHSLLLSLSSLQLEGQGSFVRQPLYWDLNVKAAIQDCPLGQLLKEYQENFPTFQKLDTDAHLSLEASVEGQWGNGRTPSVNARVRIPMSRLDYEGLGRAGRLALDASVDTDDLKEVNARLHRVLVDIAGAHIDASASVQDALGEDPLIELDGRIRARVDSLTQVFTEGIDGTGRIDARLKGAARLSQLDMVHIGAASINCDLTAQDLLLDMPADSLHASLPSVRMNLATKGNKIDRNIRQGARVLALKAEVDTLNVQRGGMFVRGAGLRLLMQNSADILKGGKELTPFMGLLKVSSLRLRDNDGLGIGLRDNTERFRIAPATAGRAHPRLTLSSESGRLIARSGANLYALRDFKFDISASRHQVRKGGKARFKRVLDSLQRVYPGVPRDSLLHHAHMRHTQPDDFSASDISISLSQSLREYVRNWDYQGSLSLERARVFMPSFPLKTALTEVSGSFDNDTLALKSLTLTSGASDVSAKATLSGLRRALLGRRHSKLKLKADVRSQFLDANQLMQAYAYYSVYEAPSSLSSASDDAVEEAATNVELPPESGNKLVVIPSNLEIDFSLEASGIRYDSLLINWAAADVSMRDRTVQVTNALAASNMGDIYFEGFYATRAKDDIKAGFDLNLVDITAEKVITLFPAMDTIMPLLTSFAGDLDCELTATSDIDTCMNLKLPTVNGILKISGKNLMLKESEEFTKLARLLMFKDKKKAVVDNMMVSGLVANNTLTVFPFLLDVDRYMLAASGTQHLSQDFNYHISVIRSPLLVKFGLNAWGPDFDHIHYGLGKAKYKSPNIPVFTKPLDMAQYNMVAAIHNVFDLGVEKALQENRSGALAAGRGGVGDVAEGSGVAVSGGGDIGVNTAEASESNEEVLAAMSRMSDTLEEVSSRAQSRREALKAEILQLQRVAAR